MPAGGEAEEDEVSAKTTKPAPRVRWRETSPATAWEARVGPIDAIVTRYGGEWESYANAGTSPCAVFHVEAVRSRAPSGRAAPSSLAEAQAEALRCADELAEWIVSTARKIERRRRK